jgi:hypothetical protein
VFMRYTGSTIRDAEAAPERERSMMQVFSKAAR